MPPPVGLQFKPGERISRDDECPDLIVVRDVNHAQVAAAGRPTKSLSRISGGGPVFAGTPEDSFHLGFGHPVVINMG